MSQAVKFESDWTALREHMLNLFTITTDTSESVLTTLTRLTDSHWFKVRYILHRLRHFEAQSAVEQQGGRLVWRLIAATHESVSSHQSDSALCCAATLLIACAPLDGDEACVALATEMCRVLSADTTRFLCAPILSTPPSFCLLVLIADESLRLHDMPVVVYPF